MSNLIDRYSYRGYTINIIPDDDPDDPRGWGNLGHMICSHRRYNLGDEQFNAEDYDSALEVEEYLMIERGAVICLPLYLIDHSGLRLNTSGYRSIDPQGWDWGLVGFIYTTIAEIDEWYGNHDQETIKKAEEQLRQEVDIYDKFISGQVYGYIVYDNEGLEISACYGWYDEKEAYEEAKYEIDNDIANRIRKHCRMLKQQIKGGAPIEYRKEISSILKEAFTGLLGEVISCRYLSQESGNGQKYTQKEETMEEDFKPGEEDICSDCMQDRDSCPDCCNGDLYRSPDAYEMFGDMER